MCCGVWVWIAVGDALFLHKRQTKGWERARGEGRCGGRGEASEGWSGEWRL